MKVFLGKVWRKKYIIPVGIAIVVIAFVLYFWSLFKTVVPNEIVVNSDNSSLWFIVSILILAVCGIVINQSFFQEKVFSKFRNIFTQMADFEDNVVYLTRDLKSDIQEVLTIIDRSNDAIADKFKQDNGEKADKMV